MRHVLTWLFDLLQILDQNIVHRCVVIAQFECNQAQGHKHLLVKFTNTLSQVALKQK